jgi:hypothetical protein
VDWKNMFSYKLFYILLPMIIGIISPSIILFLVQVFVGKRSILIAVQDIYSKQFAPGYNYFLLTIIGLIPFAVLSAIIARKVYSKAFSGKHTRLLCLFGLSGILILMIPGHFSVWSSLYGAGNASSTSVIAFFFIPFYCLITMFIGIYLFSKFQ